MSFNHPLPYPDAHYLSAAEGWLELGDAFETGLELNRIARAWRSHPEVLLLRWQLCAKAKAWGPCLALARRLTRSVPEDFRGWICLAQTFYLCGQIPKAYQTAISKVDVFPDTWVLLYDVARYSCLLGKRRQARKYLRLALAAGDRKALKRRALMDPDLEGLWSGAQLSDRGRPCVSQRPGRRSATV